MEDYDWIDLLNDYVYDENEGSYAISIVDTPNEIDIN